MARLRLLMALLGPEVPLQACATGLRPQHLGDERRRQMPRFEVWRSWMARSFPRAFIHPSVVSWGLACLAVLCCVGAADRVVAEPLHNTPTPTAFLELVEIINSDDAAPSPLGTHLDVALDRQGVLLVADPDHGRVLRYNAFAKRLEPVPVRLPTNDRLFAPQGIAIDAQGSMVLTNPDLHELLVFGHDGTFLGGTGGFESPFERPIDVAIGAEGQIYVLDQTRRTVVVLDRDGRVLHRHSLPPVAETSTRTGLTALAVARDGTIYVTDTGAHQILRLTPDGSLHRFGTKGYETGELRSPEGIAVNLRGEVLVSDAVNNALYMFTADGRFVHEYVLYKRLLQQPSRLALQREHLWVVNAGTKQLLHFRIRQARTGIEHALLGEEYLAVGYPRRAVAALRRAMALDADTVEVRYLLGLAYYELEEFQRAVEALQDVLQQRPDHIDALLYLGNAYAKLGQYARSEDAYTHVLAHDPSHVVARYNLGEAYFAHRDLTRAAQQFRQVLEMSPTYTAARLGLGRVFLQEKQYDRAETAFRTALARQSHRREAQHYLGLTLFKAGRLREAMPLLEQAASQGPHFTEALYYLGLAYAEAGMKTRAIATLQRVLELQPQHAGARRELARLQ